MKNAWGREGREVLRRFRRPVGVLGVAFALALGGGLVATGFGPPAKADAASRAPIIKHVVIILQENHSFDNVLGKLCADIANGSVVRPGVNMGCDGSTTGVLPGGATIPLAQASDVVPKVGHSDAAQAAAVDGGKMDGFANVAGCGPSDPTPYGCYTQFSEFQIPNAALLAENFAISDRTFELRNSASWVGHMVFAAATTDGFNGDNPSFRNSTSRGVGWGCDSGMVAPWWNRTAWAWEPSCVPNAAGVGPFRASPVHYVPTIFDRMRAAHLSWKIYGGSGSSGGGGGYQWSICPTFYECLGSAQRNNLIQNTKIFPAAINGTLPNLAVITPTFAQSQHNSASMAEGDNWIGQIVSAVQNGPEWNSTAIFITWDDCGCFYDHVNPLQFNPNWGVRVPMIIVSPWVKPGYTDSNPATIVSLLAFIEHNFGLPPLNPCKQRIACSDDSNVYDYSNAFLPAAAGPLSDKVSMVTTQIPPSEQAYLAAHPGNLNAGS